MLGCGVQCVIAKSFSFIFARNQPNLGLAGITIADESFHEAAKDGSEITIDLEKSIINLNGRTYDFQLSQMEKELFNHGGIASAFGKFGNKLFEVICTPKGLGNIIGSEKASSLGCGSQTQAQLQW